MDFDERKIDFEEADRRYAELKHQLDTGSISTEEFDAQRRQLMVKDGQGRWWAKGREESGWYYRDGAGWVKGTPPGYQPPPQTTSLHSSPTRDQSEGVAQTRAAPAPSQPPATQEGDQRRRSRSWLPILIVLLVLLGGASYALTRGTSEGGVEVPDLPGGAGSPGPEPTPSPTPAPQPSPAPAPVPAPVPEQATVPDLVGLSPSEAVAVLSEAGLVLGTQSEAPNAAFAAGTIIEQDIPAGTAVDKGVAVSVTVSTGPPASNEGTDI